MLSCWREHGAERVVHPYGLVVHSKDWYLIAAGAADDQIRSFRLDRIGGPALRQGNFQVPADFDAGTHVVTGLARAPWQHEVSVRVQAPADETRRRLPAGIAVVERTDEPDWVRVRLRAERLDWVPGLLVGLAHPFLVEQPAALRDEITCWPGALTNMPHRPRAHLRRPDAAPRGSGLLHRPARVTIRSAGRRLTGTHHQENVVQAWVRPRPVRRSGMARLLLVEDDGLIAESLSMALGVLGHDVRATSSAEGGLAALSDPALAFDLAVVDVMLPGMDGFEFCRRVSVADGPAIILLTARADPTDIVVGLECGADDYVVKPTDPRVLDARIKTVLRRTVAGPAESTRIPVGPTVVLDQAAMTVFRDGAPVHLTPTELRLFVELVHHRGQVMTRRLLLERVWDYGYAGDTRLVDAAVQRLRSKIEPEPSQPVLILTVRGVGYRLDAA